MKGRRVADGSGLWIVQGCFSSPLFDGWKPRTAGVPRPQRLVFAACCGQGRPRQSVSLRLLATRALSQLTDFRHEQVLRGRGEEALGRVEAAAFITAFFEA